MQYSTEFCHTRHCDRHRKELDTITIENCNKQENTEEIICCVSEETEQTDYSEEKPTFTLTEFKELVISAQQDDHKAIDVLCNAFKPLIYKEAYRYEIRKNLGEDAINTAWLIFLEQIKKYDGRDFGHLPGLLQYHIHYGLLHKVTRGKSVKDCYYLDAEEEGEGMQIADEKNDIDQLVQNQLLSEAMKKLTDAQRNIIKDVFFEDKSMQSCGEKYGISRQACFIHKERALKKLKYALVN